MNNKTADIDHLKKTFKKQTVHSTKIAELWTLYTYTSQFSGTVYINKWNNITANIVYL